MSTDSATLTQLIDMFRQREQLGLAKYGTTVDRTDLSLRDWLQHALEESMDKSLYLLRAIETAPKAYTGEPLTYSSTQATNCAGCGKHKHTPLRVDWMGGYVCLTCIDNELEGRDDTETFQARVSEWMGQCFLPSLYSNMTERGDRLLEEVLELLQSKGYDRSRVATLVDYVFGRPAGEPSQEVGGVMVTLAGYCWIAGLDMHADGERELDRINQPEVMAKIRAKQEAKNALHFDTPLPGSLPEVPGA